MNYLAPWGVGGRLASLLDPHDTAITFPFLPCSAATANVYQIALVSSRVVHLRTKSLAPHRRISREGSSGQRVVGLVSSLLTSHSLTKGPVSEAL
jgi:hypothetical protein